MKTKRGVQLSVCGVLLSGCAVVTSSAVNEFARPAWLGEIVSQPYDGDKDDLLTAGLGKTGLASATAPTFANPTAPTAAELRRAAIYNNYRALVDMTANGGFGVLFGPNIDSTGGNTLGEGKIAGREFIAYADDGTGRQNVTLMVQVPNSFSPNNACIVTATSSGSRGVYGAIGTAGEWGLKRGCAVAYTDKGTGNGGHDLGSNLVQSLDGTVGNAQSLGRSAQFAVDLNAGALVSLNAATPNRFAFKHAHSKQNPEKDWGRDTLRAVQFAFFVLNDLHKGASIKRDNTLVIASSVSNGAGAALAAAEADTEGWIDGVAVSEPNVQVARTEGLSIVRGGKAVQTFGKPLFDYFTLANLLQPCAAQSAMFAASPGANFVNAANAGNRCAALAAKGLLSGATTAEQADDAAKKLLAYGWEAESNLLHASHYAFATPAIGVTYANTYGRFGVEDHLCGFSFAATAPTFEPIAPAAGVSARLFATGNGIPPTGGINLVNNLSPNGPRLDGASTSPSTGKTDLNVDGALCLRGLVTGGDANARRVQAGIKEVQRSGNLRGKPAIIVHGRADALVPVNHSSRPYTALNKSVEGAASKLSYIEVLNAQHFDAFNGTGILGGYDTRFVPLNVYLIRALDAMWVHLKHGASLPPSQVVRTTARGGNAGAAPAITGANVPLISPAPARADQITFENGLLTIPD